MTWACGFVDGYDLVVGFEVGCGGVVVDRDGMDIVGIIMVGDDKMVSCVWEISCGIG